jgi:hypothetical protein
VNRTVLISSHFTTLKLDNIFKQRSWSSAL